MHIFSAVAATAISALLVALPGQTMAEEPLACDESLSADEIITAPKPWYEWRIGGLGVVLNVKHRLCPAAIRAVLDSGRLLDDEVIVRQKAIRSLIGTTDQQEVADALLKALSKPLYAKLRDAEIRWRRRLDSISPEISATIGPEGEYPALDSVLLVNDVAAVASQLDQTHADRIMEILRPVLHRQLYVGGNDSTNNGVILLIARSSSAEEIAEEMFDWAETGAPTYSISLMELLATLDSPGSEIQSATRDRCSKVSKSPRGFNEITCDVLFAKWGDSESLRRLEARLYDDDTSQARNTAEQVARYLSKDLESEGVPLLRKALFSNDLDAAIRVAGWLCQAAGPGNGVADRIEELATAFPDNERLVRILERCLAGW